MDWSTYTIDFQQEGRRRVELFSYILSYSRRQYISFTERQDFETIARETPRDIASLYAASIAKNQRVYPYFEAADDE